MQFAALFACPEPRELERLLLGLVPLTDAQAVRLEQHLTECSRCDRLAYDLAQQDGLLEAMRAQTLRIRSGTDALQPLIGRLKELGAAQPDAAHDTAESTPRPQAVSPQEAITLLSPPQGPDELGRLGPYRVLCFLGTGGMGVVFEAEDLQLKRRVALKIIAPNLLTSPAMRLRFLREAQATAALHHDHIITLYEVGEDRGVPYLVMQLLQGEPLDARLAREGRLPVDEVVRIGREIAEGLAAAHAHGLIHRDVKPANVWLEAPAGRVKLLDFGLARLADDAGQSHHGFVLGTPHYMAPEQADGAPLDGRCDLFSLGCVLYRMATGKLPFPGAGTLTVLRSLAVEPPRPPRQLNPEIPPALADLILRLFAKEPSYRPPSAAAVGAALAAVKRAGPFPAVRTRRRLLGVTAALVLGLALGVVAYPHGPALFPAAPQRPAPGATVASRSLSPPVTEVVGETRRFEGHRNSVNALAFAPDGGRILSGSGGWRKNGRPVPGDDHTVRVWDVASGRELWCFRGASYRVSRVAFTADGQQALGGRTVVCAVQHWDLESGQELPGFSGAPHRPFWAVAFSGDGRRALTAGQDGMLRVWNVGDGRELGAFAGPLEAVHGLAVSPDARLAASAGGGHYPDLDQGPQRGTDFSIRLWDLEAGKEHLRLKGHETYVWAVAFSPDGRRLLSGGAAGTLRLWDTRTGEELHRFHGHATSVSAVAFSADSRLALSGSSDATVRLWDVASGRERCRFRGHTAGVRCVAFAPDGRHVLSGSEDATVRLWAVPEEALR